MFEIKENGTDKTYTVSKALVHIIVGIVVTTSLAVMVSIVSWWFGFAAWQSHINSIAENVALHDIWFRSGMPSPITTYRLDELDRRLEILEKQDRKIGPVLFKRNAT